ncbi:unnamed protein product [Adineta ricciae]|uniref:Uncharacterized protein n=1 Tax=Adineta ricciae TaxID=249248 RepID=A0A815MJ20_ADIRI|nr:unnamed protein product [Adineta ricciae]
MSFKLNRPPYADMIGILSPRVYDTSIHHVTHERPSRTSSPCFIKYCDRLIKIILILGLLLFSIPQIILACFNCPLTYENLGWIRASLFMNVPFVLGIFIFLIRKLIRREWPLYFHIVQMAVAYVCVPGWHLFIDLFIFTGAEMNDIRVTLQNKKAVMLLSCPERYYQCVFGMIIMQCVFPIVLVIVSCILNNCFDTRSKSCGEKIEAWYYTRWRHYMDVLCERHIEEFV